VCPGGNHRFPTDDRSTKGFTLVAAHNGLSLDIFQVGHGLEMGQLWRDLPKIQKAAQGGLLTLMIDFGFLVPLNGIELLTSSLRRICSTN
jgi:hypothetical protein